MMRGRTMVLGVLILLSGAEVLAASIPADICRGAAVWGIGISASNLSGKELEQDHHGGNSIWVFSTDRVFSCFFSIKMP